MHVFRIKSARRLPPEHADSSRCRSDVNIDRQKTISITQSTDPAGRSGKALFLQSLKRLVRPDLGGRPRPVNQIYCVFPSLGIRTARFATVVSEELKNSRSRVSSEQVVIGSPHANLSNSEICIGALRKVIVHAETLGHKIREFLTDNGGEFTGSEVRNILAEFGISHRLTAPFSPEQNGGSELQVDSDGFLLRRTQASNHPSHVKD